MLQFVQFTGRSQAQHPHFNPFDSNHLNLSHIFSNQPKFLPTARHVVKTNFDPRGPPPNKFKTLNKAADSFVFCFFFLGGKQVTGLEIVVGYWDTAMFFLFLCWESSCHF